MQEARLDRELQKDIMIYGNAFHTAVARKWWNPMRFLLGDIKRKRISPAHVFHSIGKRDWRAEWNALMGVKK